jgi:PHYB activation tagged suppressor 1
LPLLICRFLPTTNNRKIAKLQFELNEGLKQLVQGRQDEVRMGKFPYGNDLLGLMLLALDKNREKDMDMSKHELSLQALVDECKTFFLGGSETTSSSLTWTLLLLAEYQEWQECARAEILEVCGCNINNLNATMITKMKIVSVFVCVCVCVDIISLISIFYVH